MGLSLETLALAKKYADAVAAAGSQEAIQKAIERAVNESKLYTDKVVGELSEFNITLVDSLPVTDIKTHTIYFIPMSLSESDNGYYEYMYINNKWELIGNTRIDLSDYYTKQEVEQYILDNKYVLPIASNSTLGGVKIDGTSIKIDENGVISVNTEKGSVAEQVARSTAQEVIDENFNGFTSISDDDIKGLFLIKEKEI